MLIFSKRRENFLKFRCANFEEFVSAVFWSFKSLNRLAKVRLFSRCLVTLELMWWILFYSFWPIILCLMDENENWTKQKKQFNSFSISFVRSASMAPYVLLNDWFAYSKQLKCDDNFFPWCFQGGSITGSARFPNVKKCKQQRVELTTWCVGDGA